MHYPPTPPYSPSALPSSSHENHPLVLQLNSLIDSYQRRRMWVCQFRANLETAQSEPTQTSSPASSEDSLHLPDESTPKPTNNTRWARRKRGFKLRLEGLPTKPKRITTQCDQSGPTPSREDILAMYEKMMESRMESCQRINRLIHSANRASLRDR